jgi:hypothetical protein
MIAIIYRGYLKPNREADYRRAWHIVASYFVEKRGALGSCLHQAADGMWVAYSRWPDKATRDASWPGDDAPSFDLPDKVREAIIVIQDSTDQDRKLPEICLDVVEDLLLK